MGEPADPVVEVLPGLAEDEAVVGFGECRRASAGLEREKAQTRPVMYNDAARVKRE